MMSEPSEHKPVLLNASALAESDVGSFEWDRSHNSCFLTVSDDGRSIEWDSRKPEGNDVIYPPVWVPASTRLHLHSGEFQWDFVVEEMAHAQIGVGFMLLWNVGPDWGIFGYLGASPTAWSYDPSTGDVVYNTDSIQSGLPQFVDGRAGVVSIHLDLPRHAEGSAKFRVCDADTRCISLPKGAVVLPAACFQKETQRVRLAGYERS